MNRRVLRAFGPAVLLVAASASLPGAADAADPVTGVASDAPAWYDFGGNGSYLGVYLENLSEGVRRALGLDEGLGVLLQRLVDDGPAARAGLAAGDVLLELGGNRIDSSSRLSRVLDRYEPGDEVELVVWRQRARKTFRVTLGERQGYSIAWGSGIEAPVTPDFERVAPLIYSGLGGGGAEQLGLRTEELTGQLAAFFEVDHGVLVVWVRRDTRAERGGVKAGDVILSVAGQNVQNASDLDKTLRELRRGEEFELGISRKGKRETRTIPR